MPVYNAPTKDTQFILHDVLKISQSDIPGYSELEAEFTGAVLEEAGRVEPQSRGLAPSLSCAWRRHFPRFQERGSEGP